MKRLTIEDICERVLSYSNGEYEVLECQDYKNAHQKLNLLHTVCNKVFEMSIANLIDNTNKSIKTGCTHCRYIKSGNAQKFSIDDFIQSLNRKDINEYTILGKYVDTNTKILVRHNCGYEYKVRPREMKQGNCCPRCSSGNRASKGEIEMREYIRSILPEDVEVQFNARRLIPNSPNTELDVYIPSMNIGFEFNGIHWHDGDRIGLKDYKKFKQFYQNEIRVIMFYETEWYFKQDIVKNKIAHILGVNKTKRINASDCVVVGLDNCTKEKNEFLDKNHIQGADKATKKYGLAYNGELVAVMTFTKARASLNQEDRDDYLELSRFATDINYIIRGGFNKILKYLVNETDELDGINIIGTFANRRFSYGNVYNMSSFNFIHETKPSYWFYKMGTIRRNKPSKLYHRFTFNKYNIHKMYINGKLEHYDSSLNDKQNMKNNGYSYIYDYGNLYFELDLNEYRR